MQDFNTNVYGQNNGRWVGRVQSEKVQDSEKGLRVRVAIMGIHPMDESLKEEDTRLAYIQLGVCDGTGAKGAVRTPRISQGDVVTGYYWDTDNQYPVIDGCLGRNPGIIYGSGKFDTKSGYLENDNPTESVGRQEFNDQLGLLCTPKPKADTSKQNRQLAAQRQQLEEAGILYKCPSDSNTSKRKIINGDPCKNNFFMEAETALENFFNKITRAGKSVVNLPRETKKVVRILTRSMSGFITSVIGALTEKLVDVISEGMKQLEQKAREVFEGNQLLASLKEITKRQTDQISPIDNLFKGLTCLGDKLIKATTGIFTDLINASIKSMVNTPVCAIKQILGGFSNAIIDLIDKATETLLDPIAQALEFVFKAKDFLIGIVNTLRKVSNLFGCDDDKKCPASVKYVNNVGLVGDKSESEQQDLFNQITADGALSRGVANLADDFERQYGKWSIFGQNVGDSRDTLGGCYTGNVFECGSPKVQFFGGDGIGATGKVILGKYVDALDTEDIVGSVQKTASIVGVEIEDPGSGYSQAPFVSFGDACDRGYGAFGRANINSQGQVTSVSIISQGENYPADDVVEPLYIKDVVIENPGYGYQEDDTAEGVDITITDGQVTAVSINNFGYNGLPNLNINSNTGVGAILRPIMSVLPPQKEVIQVIDCVRS